MHLVQIAHIELNSADSQAILGISNIFENRKWMFVIKLISEVVIFSHTYIRNMIKADSSDSEGSNCVCFIHDGRHYFYSMRVASHLYIDIHNHTIYIEIYISAENERYSGGAWKWAMDIRHSRALQPQLVVYRQIYITGATGSMRKEPSKKSRLRSKRVSKEFKKIFLSK